MNKPQPKKNWNTYLKEQREAKELLGLGGQKPSINNLEESVRVILAKHGKRGFTKHQLGIIKAEIGMMKLRMKKELEIKLKDVTDLNTKLYKEDSLNTLLKDNGIRTK
jgi:hypothetical protein